MRRTWILLGTTIAALTMTPGTAVATKGGGSSQGAVTTHNEQHNQTLTSQISYTGAMSGNGKNSPGAISPISNWAPPACWYEPRSAATFKKYLEGMYSDTVNYPGQANYAKSAVSQYRDIYKDGKYKNYNLDKSDEGNWWVAVQNANRLDSLDAFSCSELPFWVKNGEDPGVKNAVTPEVLSQLAYDRIHVPDTKVTLAPAGATKVNLPTWAWLDSAKFKPVSVTASLNVPGANISATTTATPESLKLEPGTTDAETYPTSGECPIVNGSIGTPYIKGDADKIPPCGLTYLRASGDNGPYKLRATITWKINWTGTGGSGGDLPDGTFGTTQDVTVEEIQAINR
ncbi:hypothetical protein OIE60_13385 [Streptomyces sp. NBC_01766]|nr:hypothetical protein OIE60_13385 [Streptomyces sp. NBC_01766]